MPVAAFPASTAGVTTGSTLWQCTAVHGGPDGLKQFVDACHERGLAVLLDVVYNHQASATG